MLCVYRMMSSLTARKVRVARSPDLDLHVELRGNGKIPLVLIPGALGSGATDFQPQLDNLDRDLFSVVAPDPRGYGKSRPPERDFPADYLRRDASDINALMQELGHSRYVVAGWSDGAIVAAIMAASFQKHVAAAILHAVNCYIDEKDAEIYESVRDVSRWSDRMRKPLEDVYGGTEGLSMINNAWADAFLWFYRENGGDVCRSEVDQVKCPTLIVHGAKDAIVPLHHGAYVQKRIPGSILHVLSDGKHNLHFKYAAEFNKLVTDFARLHF